MALVLGDEQWLSNIKNCFIEYKAATGLSQVPHVDITVRSSSSDNLNAVYVHVVDSQVGLGVPTKRRTSSGRLRRAMRSANGFCLACNLMPVFLRARPKQKPADAALMWQQPPLASL